MNETESLSASRDVLCECGHTEVQHNLSCELLNCTATIYTGAPLGGGSAYPCSCRGFRPTRLPAHLDAAEMRKAIIAALPKLQLHRGRTLTKADEVGLEWADEMLSRAAGLCDVCQSAQTTGFTDKFGVTEYLCAEHADLADDYERSRSV